VELSRYEWSLRQWDWWPEDVLVRPVESSDIMWKRLRSEAIYAADPYLGFITSVRLDVVNTPASQLLGNENESETACQSIPSHFSQPAESKLRTLIDDTVGDEEAINRQFFGARARAEEITDQYLLMLGGSQTEKAQAALLDTCRCDESIRKYIFKMASEKEYFKGHKRLGAKFFARKMARRLLVHEMTDSWRNLVGTNLLTNLTVPYKLWLTHIGTVLRRLACTLMRLLPPSRPILTPMPTFGNHLLCWECMKR
jgi:hypothetical protein